MGNECCDYATAATMTAIVLGLAITQDLSADDQNAVANLLFAAAQAISTRASLMPTQQNGCDDTGSIQSENTQPATGSGR